MTKLLTPINILTPAKSTLSSIPAMNYSQLPKATSKIIDKIQRDFISGSTSEKIKMNYISCDRINKPKEHSGLGILHA